MGELLQGEGRKLLCGDDGVKRKQADMNFPREKRVSLFPTAFAGCSRKVFDLKYTATDYF